ncbi:helix-turn-helix domain-containing protein [Tuwongella immobilis]|uniref:: HTH_17 n=1 Tax=Tuwongella immobilis TaxID=692036 RepID=A0A6C2YNT3_9BACT|nr:helix-turn-helix domain-containing protein [Tuwongella immobilis]VIP03096.1 : HTH_17 [Tuwongella immobilis]VTS03375.1 : HTH_17 [Tuwongella immobilis]
MLTKSQQPPTVLALRAPEAAQAIGISERMLWDLTDRIPHVKVGRCIVFPIKELQEWLSQNAQTKGGETNE